FHWGQDMEFAYLDVKKNLGSFETDENVKQIDVYRFDPNAAPLMTLAFTGEVDRVQVTNFIENTLKPRLETIKGVAYVKDNGASQQEVEMLVNEDIMSQYRLTPAKLVEVIKNYNISRAGGVIVEGNEEMVLKFTSRFRTVDEIGRCVIAVIGGHPLRLGDLGEIRLGASRDEVRVHQDGRPTVSLDVYREPDANAVQTARAVREVVAGLNARGDYGLKIAVDQSRDVEAAIGEVVDTAVVGMGLAVLVLVFFLRSFSATFITAISIPISIIATFAIMHFQGLSLNIMTLGGLALGAGMLVDNAIVVIENVFRHRQEGAGRVEAAAVGTREVALAIIASTLTTIVVFVPLVYVHGIAGILFRDQALTVVYSLLLSLLVALVLIPMLAARGGTASSRPVHGTGGGYGRYLAFSLRWRWALLAVFIAALAASWQAARRIPSEFFPESVAGRMTMQLELPPGTPLDQTEMSAARLEHVLLAMRYRDPALAPLLRAWEGYRISGNWPRFRKAAQAALLELSRKGPANPLLENVFQVVAPAPPRETEDQLAERIAKAGRLLDPLIVVESVTTTVGTAADSVEVADEKIHGSHTARIDVVLNPDHLRELAAGDVIGLLRAEAARIPGLTCSFESRNEFLQQLFGKNRGDIAIEVHAEQFPDLQTAAAAAADRLREVPGLVNARTNLVWGEEEYILEPDYDALYRGGFAVADLSAQIQNYLRGEKTDPLKLAQGEMAVEVSNPRAEIGGLQGLLNLQIVGQAPAAGGQAPRDALKNLTQLRRERGVREIMRIGQERTVLAMADLQGTRYDRAIAAVRQKLDAMAWPRGASWNISGEEVKRRESFDKLFFALVIAIVLVYMVIASILESIIHPLTIMLSIPFALTGVVTAFLLTGISLNLMGYIGIVMLTGIVVNNAIVLLDRVRQLREAAAGEEGETRATLRDALIIATRQRVRPILMTSLTTILALVPLALGVGNGAELRRPMAIAVIGGLTASTVLTLWILPAFYLCVEDVKGLFVRRKR
ncbi:MAG: efflux RND transporter permease subunit, partial [bacterium]|nr:efflux RND transporter permease subunit [bacterium]